MEIIEESPRRLILRSRLWRVWLADLIFCGGSAVPIGFAARYELVCHHQVRIITIRFALLIVAVAGCALGQRAYRSPKFP